VPPLVPVGREAELIPSHSVHHRETGAELPWAPTDPSDRFEVYEAPVLAPPGRYLWIRLHLSGTTAVAPRVRAVRVEIPAHDLLGRLPATYQRDEVAADFLQRYLGIIDGFLVEVEARAARRDLLLDPFGAPTEVLPWLASLVALTLDQRWPEPARRTMIDEAICLFRRRGTIGALRRMLQIVLDCDVVIVEAYRFRGTGGASVGDEGSAGTVVGVDLRVGGQVGDPDAEPLVGTVEDAFRTHAHRFTVLVPRQLDDEQDAMVRHLLELHRPAHTLFDLCTVGRGMRIGVGLHVELSTLVGPSAGFSRAVLGETRIGTNAVVGTPRAGVRAGGSRLGDGLVVDP
jgi:phage tail-like protein